MRSAVLVALLSASAFAFYRHQIDIGAIWLFLYACEYKAQM